MSRPEPIRRWSRSILLAGACALVAACSGTPDDPDAGDVTPDAGETTPDAGGTTPDTTIATGPEGTTSETGATFTFTCDATACTFACALDGGAFEACESPKAYADLAPGEHTFKVQATTAAGTDATPATRTWTIEAPPPDTTLAGGPEGTTHVISATFTLGTDTEGATFECALDDAAFAACTSPVTLDDVADGEHTFKARAVLDGKADPTPATHAWTVDTLRQPRKWVDRAGNVFIADTANCVVRKVSVRDGTISTVAGTGGECISEGDGGAATSAKLDYPLAVALGPTGDLFIAEDGDRIRMIDHATGIITTVVGGGAEEIADGAAPTSGAISSAYTLYVNDAGDLFFGASNRVRVLRASTGLVTTVAGGAATCTEPTNGANALEICFNQSIFAVAAGAGGTSYVSSGLKVFRLEAAGTLTHVAGRGTYDSDGDNGPAVDAGFRYVSGLAADAAGNLFFADVGGNAVRKVTASTGVISTVVGTLGTSGSTGDGGAATAALLNGPGDVAFDAAGNLYVADMYNNVVRKVDQATGVISLVAGNYTRGYSGDGASATEAQLARPAGFFWWWD